MTDPQIEADSRALLLAAALGVVALAAIAVLAVLALSGSQADPEPAVREREAPGAREAPRAREAQPRRRVPAERKRLFARTSFWNRPLPRDKPLDPNSAVLVQYLAEEVNRELQAGIGPSIATVNSSTPLYRVGPDQGRVRVRLDAKGVPGAKALQRAFAAVPIPPGAKPAAGLDRHLTVWQPATDTLWEFFEARRRAGEWHARWGGGIRRVSKSRGYYTPAAWPGATRNWGATASSLPVIAGTILRRELRAGKIDHALAMNVAYARAGTFAWPAQQTDGVGAPTTLPAGARLRLDPSLDIGGLGLPQPVRMIARAAQRYGLVVRDQTTQAISLFAEDPAPHGGSYRRLFEGSSPSELLAQFPWANLQVLEMNLCTSAPCRRR